MEICIEGAIKWYKNDKKLIFEINKKCLKVEETSESENIFETFEEFLEESEKGYIYKKDLYDKFKQVCNYNDFNINKVPKIKDLCNYLKSCKKDNGQQKYDIRSGNVGKERLAGLVGWIFNEKNLENLKNSSILTI